MKIGFAIKRFMGPKATWCFTCIMLTIPYLNSAEATEKEAKVAFSRVAESFEISMQEEQVVGGSLYLIHDGEVLSIRHYGFADRDSKRKVDQNTLFHWASNTKTFTAIAFMQLVNQGKLNLEDSVVKYLPELKAVHNPFGSMEDITLRHLLTHSAGFRGATWPWGGDEDWHIHEPTRWSQLVAMMPYTKIHFEPGSKFDYSNLGLTLLGQVIKVVSGDDIEVYIDKNILKPLNMTRSYFDVTPWYLQPHRSHSYQSDGDELVDLGSEFDTGITTGNGGLNGPVTDMIHYVNFLLNVNDNGNYRYVLPRLTLETMFEPAFEIENDSAMDISMGKSFFLYSAKGNDGTMRRYVGHSGRQKGFITFFYINQASRSAVIMAINTIPTIGKIFNNTRRALFEEVFPLLDNN